jgi:pimeloyl-ACP methyl ester carboxylesterase
MGETATHGVFERADAAIAWRSEGSGLPLVFVHGGGMDARMWRPQADAFSGSHRVITYDQRGHGDSECDAGAYSLDSATADLTGLLGQLGVERAVLVGHSFGASVAQYFAALHPDRVAALACVGGAPLSMTPGLSARMRTWLNGGAVPLLGRRRVEVMFANMAGAREEVRLYAANALSRLSDRMFGAVMQVGFGVPGIESGNYRFRAPLLLVYGDCDPYGAYFTNTARWVARDRARLVCVAQAAHNANQDVPDEVNEELARLLCEVE